MAEDKSVIKLELKRVDLTELLKLDDMLGTAPLFKAIGPADTSRLIAAASMRRYQSGQPIYAEGSQGNSLFVVLRGEVVLARGQAKNAVEVATVRKGEIFGEAEALGPSTTRSYGVTAPTLADVAEFPFVQISALCKRHFELYGLLRETRDERAKAKDDLADFLNRW